MIEGSATESGSEGQSLEMFLRGKKVDLVTDLMWDWKEWVESRMIPRLRTSDDGKMEQPSMFRNRALGATTMSSVLLLFNLRGGGGIKAMLKDDTTMLYML